MDIALILTDKALLLLVGVLCRAIMIKRPRSVILQNNTPTQQLLQLEVLVFLLQVERGVNNNCRLGHRGTNQCFVFKAVLYLK